jgi:hypothetical protein
MDRPLFTGPFFDYITKAIPGKLLKGNRTSQGDFSIRHIHDLPVPLFCAPFNADFLADSKGVRPKNGYVMSTHDPFLSERFPNDYDIARKKIPTKLIILTLIKP